MEPALSFKDHSQITTKYLSWIKLIRGNDSTILVSEIEMWNHGLYLFDTPSGKQSFLVMPFEYQIFNLHDQTVVFAGRPDNPRLYGYSLDALNPDELNWDVQMDPMTLGARPLFSQCLPGGPVNEIANSTTHIYTVQDTRYEKQWLFSTTDLTVMRSGSPTKFSAIGDRQSIFFLDDDRRTPYCSCYSETRNLLEIFRLEDSKMVKLCDHGVEEFVTTHPMVRSGALFYVGEKRTLMVDMRKPATQHRVSAGVLSIQNPCSSILNGELICFSKERAMLNIVKWKWES